MSIESREPVIILAPPCTFSWVICAMLGQHPDLYGFPELHLFNFETMSEWLEHASSESYDLDHGLLRAVAELVFGGQSDASIERANGWLRRRAHFSTGLLLETLLASLGGRAAVEKSPSIVYRMESMQRAAEMFPGARFLHLVSHPRVFGELVMRSLAVAERPAPLNPSHWLIRLATFPYDGCQQEVEGVAPAVLDPQCAWYALHTLILNFLEQVPRAQQRILRGEDLLSGSEQELRNLAVWLDVTVAEAALSEMRHPERSVYASRGPSMAPFGTDIFLRDEPLLPPEWVRPRTLEDPLEWRADGQEFLPEVKRLAQRWGYT